MYRYKAQCERSIMNLSSEGRVSLNFNYHRRFYHFSRVRRWNLDFLYIFPFDWRLKEKFILFFALLSIWTNILVILFPWKKGFNESKQLFDSRPKSSLTTRKNVFSSPRFIFLTNVCNNQLVETGEVKATFIATIYINKFSLIQLIEGAHLRPLYA